jgi:hypothetical protein
MTNVDDRFAGEFLLPNVEEELARANKFNHRMTSLKKALGQLIYAPAVVVRRGDLNINRNRWGRSLDG